MLKSWINTLPPLLNNEFEKYITGLFEWAVPPLLYVLRKQCKVCIVSVSSHIHFVILHYGNKSEYKFT